MVLSFLVEGNLKGHKNDTKAELIDLIIYALEQSMPKEQWRPFLYQLRDARKQIIDVFPTEYATKLNYDEVIAGLMIILGQYKRHVEAGA